ncbi:hypothetical protein ACQ4M3_09460 [Leptolyngbya sp. AN03gr2]|uniref:hypothetical protein n=1 Tax=Leptolyngbya sp. AN03gr2 TaxID=3423364 RepID=UPI003D31EE10
MQYKLTNTLFLTVIENRVQVQPVQEAVNHLWLVDRSGSMAQLLPRLIEDLKRVASTLREGDTLSFGYFSGESEFRFPIKGFQILNASVSQLNKLLDEQKTTLSLTCFSEILEESSNVVGELSFITDRFSLYLFTDGYPVVSDYSRELERIKNALARLSPKLLGSLVVGYGDWCNRDLLSSMSNQLGGAFIHSYELESAYQALGQFSQSISVQAPKMNLDIPPSLFVFTLADSGIQTYLEENGTVSVPLSTNQIFCVGEEEQNPLPIEKCPQGCLYALSYLFNQRTETDLSLSLMSQLGDVYFVNHLSTAFTNEEHAEVESELLRAVYQEDLRFRSGQTPNVLPDPDQFCVLDLVERLEQHPAWFYPYHSEFQYKKIGAERKVKPGYPKFSAESETASLSGLTWHETRMNLSVRVEIPGVIDLGEEAETVGLPQLFHTKIIRNYTLIKDGVLWTTRLPIQVHPDIFNQIYQSVPSAVLDYRIESESVYVLLDLSDLPLINPKIAASASPETAQSLAILSVRNEEVAARRKTYRYLLDELEEGSSSLSNQFTPEQQNFLESKGVRRSGYNPPTENPDTEDFYLAPALDIKVPGYSSLPKVLDVINRVKAGSRLNAPSQVMALALSDFQAVKTINEDRNAQIQWLRNALLQGDQTLQTNRRFIQQAKFSVLLSKRWFFPTRDHNEVEVSVASNATSGSPSALTQIKVKFEKKTERVEF